jgi:hypothetical protein
VIPPRRQPNPLALAVEWVAKITTVGLEMALPAIGGKYLDDSLGTSYWALAGVIVGVVVGMWHLIQMTRSKSTRGGMTDSKGSNGGTAGR